MSSKWVRSGRMRAAVTLICGVALVTGCDTAGQALPEPTTTPASTTQAPPGIPVVLTARTADGTPPTPETMSAAKQIIQWRAEGMGLAGTTVTIKDDTLVITVPDDDGSAARRLAQTGELAVRPVLTAVPPTGSGPAAPDATAAKISRQSSDPAVQQQAIAELDCAATDPLRGADDPALPLVTCAADGSEVLLLGPSVLDNRAISDARAHLDPQSNRHVVDVTFTAEAADRFEALTTENVNRRIAFVVDTVVVSAPMVVSPTSAGQTQIAGNFTAESAGELANSLRFGKLPVPFAER
ncbi:preprotein translocase subunit SecD [Nocardia cyriacigeorgica]|uniref:preprotein translocase subunit SecD n=1 Tax=Nocardia cyriacigeorgica TaxID=135487 RepID=UPI0002EB385C|nr:hypothetical protein [Nocardia cyriacigeorgica]MBF6499036.1 hypothetical protein [Nocardia cyriacigeorgica]TLF54102.1 hypothetical protein FEK31_25340 [Nocardia cyriacigeorgica]